MHSRPRRRFAAAVATVTAALLAFAGLTAAPALAAEPGPVQVTDAEFRWGFNEESSRRAYAPGTWNFFSAGLVDKTSAADLVTEAEWKPAEGNVSIEKRLADSAVPATWAGLRTDANGTATTIAGPGSDHEVVIANGVGEVDAAAGTASIQWTGTFTVAYYSGMTQFYVKDPLLTVDADGTGTVTATLGGWGTSMEDTELFVVLDEAPGVEIATLQGVAVGADGITVTPDYLGVEIVAPATSTPQTTGTATSGSFPQSFIDYIGQTGGGSYWYSSGGAADPHKPTKPLSIAYTTAPTVTPASITTQPASVTVEAPARAVFSVVAAGDEPLTYQWQRSADGSTWTDIAGATSASYTLDATATADSGAQVRVVVDNAAATPVTSEPATLTVTEPAAGTIEVVGAQLEWAYSGYAQSGVFGPWRMWTEGEGVSTAKIAAETVSTRPADAGTLFNAARFDGGVGVIDEETGAGTITWPAAGSWKINAYPAMYGAPDETLSEPILTIAEDGTGTLSFSAYLPKHNDIMYGTGLLPAVGPDRKVIATFSEVSFEDGVLRVVPDFAGREYTPAEGTSPWATCEGAGGSWPAEWIDFLPTSVRAHYYTTSCSGLNLTKPPFAFTVDTEASAVAIQTQPASSLTTLQAGTAYDFSVVASGNPVSYQWQRSVDGTTWADVAGQTDRVYTATAAPGDDGASFRVVVGEDESQAVSSVVGPFEVTTTPISVDYQPADVSIGIGEDNQIFAGASGAPIPTLRWEKLAADGITWVEVTGAMAQVSGTTAVSYLQFLDAEEADAGNYRAIVSNGYHDDVITDVAEVRVLSEVPTVTTNPRDTYAIDGQAVRLIASATGTPTPSVEWQTSADSGETWTVWPGADATSTQISVDASLDMDGTLFRARMHSPAGETFTDTATLTVFERTEGVQLIAVPAADIDSAIDNEILVLGAGFDPDQSPGDPALTVAVTSPEVWQPGASGVTDGHVVTRAIADDTFQSGDGYLSVRLTVPAGALAADAEYGIATFSADPEQRDFDGWTALSLAGAGEPHVISETATFEWGINAASQGASFNGACSFFVAGIADGTEASYKTVDGDVVLVKRGMGGQPIEVTAENRCAPIVGSDGRQRVLFTNGVATEDASGVVTVQWAGAFTIYSYGGLVPWYVKDPKLTVNTDGTGSITAELGGFASSMADPNVKEPLAPEPDMTILDLKDVSIDGDVIRATPVFEGVDYYRLNDPMDPDSGRVAQSAIPDYAKEANPHWGSWPTDIVDFHYRTGLSSYWHSSGLSADPNKPPLPIELNLAAEPLDYEQLESVSIITQPVALDVFVGEDAEFSVEGASAGDRGLTYQWQITTDGVTWTDIPGATESTLVIEDAEATSTERDPYIQVVVGNGVQGIVSDSVRFRAMEAQAPVIEYQPEDQARYAGADIYLGVYASGFPTPTYQWESSTDGGATWVDYAPPATHGNLTLAAVSAELDGTMFRAVIGNGVGAGVVSEEVLVSVLEADGPTMSVHGWTPQYPIDAATGGDVYVFGGGLPDPRTSDIHIGIVSAADWNSRGADFSSEDLLFASGIQTEWNVFNGAWGPWGVTVPGGELDPSTAYVIAIVSDTAGDRSYDTAMPLQLVGQGAPVISAQPVGASALAGGAVEFSAGVTAVPAATYQWQRSVDGTTWTDIEGATGTTLSVTGGADVASYRLVATNAFGSTTSEAAQLTLLPQPTVTVSKTSGLDPNGETVTVTGSGFLPNGTATNGTRPPFAGQFGGAYVIFGKFAENWKPSTGGSGRNVITQYWAVPAAVAEARGGLAAGYVGIDATGSFSVDVEVKTGAVDKTGTYGIYTYGGSGANYAPFETATTLTLTGEQAPAFVGAIADVIAPSTGGVAAFTAAVTGAPTPTIAWERLVGSEWVDVEGATGASLALAYGAEDDGAQVRAVATNAFGTVASEPATLSVGDAAAITSQPASATVTAGDGALFEVGYAGDDATVQWQVKQPGSATWLDLEGATTGELVVSFAEARSGQLYRAVVTGSVPLAAGGAEFSVTSAEASLTLTAPGQAAADIPDDALSSANDGDLSVVSQNGRTLVIDLGADRAAQMFGVWAHSTPTWLGWSLASTSGQLTVTLPASVEAGTHRLIVVDASGALVGWLTVEIAADGVVTVPADGLTRTGGQSSGYVAAAALLLMAGAALVFGGRRRRTVA